MEQDSGVAEGMWKSCDISFMHKATDRKLKLGRKKRCLRTIQEQKAQNKTPNTAGQLWTASIAVTT
jgi:hypothetical protein